jgi:hypothetical protein
MAPAAVAKPAENEVPVFDSSIVVHRVGIVVVHGCGWSPRLMNPGSANRPDPSVPGAMMIGAVRRDTRPSPGLSS